MPKEGEPPFSTYDGMKAFFEGAYKGWVESAAKLAKESA